ncbi:SFT2-domain-containing protein [Conidiobolus coronatus NRRL 28638]|uniref:Protein transport protein SFT2 n=1 Tax=Conidiobolus coronatus (strain ATCC 28846 / CBS 209.66 / NRRL 28638) TaxID=796925 RepID=A0A137P2G5_CONC2|nr:SFT2-domain-containing protein [Conidiobolus coronatus NRRL 28638]|eukprot:KXN69240.1 SFT2-domain-containing protein [Conidiobolus coronatus NRRL 28638]
MSSSSEQNFKNLLNKSSFRTNSGSGVGGSSSSTGGSTFSNWSNKFTSSTSTLFSNISNQAQGYMPVTTNQPPQEPSWFSLTLWQRWTGFGMCVLAGALLFLLSFLNLTVFIVKPRKFALSFSFGSLFFFASIAFLRGPVTHFKSIFNLKQLPFSAAYFGSLIMTLVSTLIIKSFILTIVFLVIQIIALVWYFMSFMPGGSRLIARTATSFLPI